MFGSKDALRRSLVRIGLISCFGFGISTVDAIVFLFLNRIGQCEAVLGLLFRESWEDLFNDARFFARKTILFRILDHKQKMQSKAED